MNLNEFNYCRPKEGYFCVECCRGRRCINLAILPDGTTGCRGHDNELVHEGAFYQLPNCREMFCLTNGYQIEGEKIDTPERLERIKQTILRLPPGEFRMSHIINTTRNEKEKLCQTETGYSAM